VPAEDVIAELQKTANAERCWPCLLMGAALILYGCALIYANWKVNRG
jgi:hypothetical protein